MQVELFSSDMFQNMIGKEFMEQIKLVQYGLDLNDQEKSDCLFLIKHSPSALFYSINADKFLHTYEAIAPINPEMKKLMHNHFFRQLVKLFEEDFSNPVFSTMMRNNFSIAELNNHTTICLQTEEETRQISFEQKLLLVPIEGFQQPILLSHILEAKKIEIQNYNWRTTNGGRDVFIFVVLDRMDFVLSRRFHQVKLTGVSITKLRNFRNLRHLYSL